jgi:hypothetical protein
MFFFKTPFVENNVAASRFKSSDTDDELDEPEEELA